MDAAGVATNPPPTGHTVSLADAIANEAARLGVKMPTNTHYARPLSVRVRESGRMLDLATLRLADSDHRVVAVLDRVAVIEDASDHRSLIALDKAVVNEEDIRWVAFTDKSVIDAASRRRGLRRSGFVRALSEPLG